MHFPKINTLPSGRFSNEKRLRSWIAGPLLAVMGTAMHHADAETFKYLRCNMVSVAPFGEPENSKPDSSVLHVAFDEKANKVLEASGETWNLPGSSTSSCRVNVSPREIDVFCEPGELAQTSIFSGFNISRTTGKVSRTIGGTRANGYIHAFIASGSCVLLNSDPLIPQSKLF